MEPKYIYRTRELAKFPVPTPHRAIVSTSRLSRNAEERSLPGDVDLKGGSVCSSIFQVTRTLIANTYPRPTMSAAFNVGIIGYGLSAKIFHIPYIKATPQFAVRAIVTRSNATEAQEDNPEATVYESVTELVQDDDVNVVIVATPPDTHFDLASRALKAGKHGLSSPRFLVPRLEPSIRGCISIQFVTNTIAVVVEKPFAPKVSECDTLIHLAKERNRILTVYQNRRWDADFATLRRLLADNTLGTVLEFESHFDRYTPPEILIPGPGEPGTGVIYDLGTHLIDQALVLFGLPERVTGFLSMLDDACTVLLHYRSGLLITLKASATSAETEQLRFWVRGKTGAFRKVWLLPKLNIISCGSWFVGYVPNQPAVPP